MLMLVQDGKAHLDCVGRTIFARRYAYLAQGCIQTHRSPTTTGYTATVFGATGFLGRYIVNRLGV